MTLSVRQTVTGFAAAAATTVSADFTDSGSGGIGAALAGSLILFIVGGDKNSGTFTPPSDTPNVPVDLRTADVSLMMAWGTADGGETVVSGTIGSNAGGSQITLVEIVDSVNTGAWSVAASATHNSDGSTVTVWSTGTTGAASADAIAVAAVAADSVNTAGTPTWSNSYTANRITPSGGGQAGLWGSYSLVSSAATAETTLTRTGGTADQHSGAILAFTRAAGTITGALAGSTPKAVGALTGNLVDQGVMAGSTSPAVGALAGLVIVRGVVAGAVASVHGAITGDVPDLGGFAASTPLPTAAITGQVIDRGVLAGTTPLPVSTLAGKLVDQGVLAGSTRLPVSTIVGTHPTIGTLAGRTRMPKSTLREVTTLAPGEWRPGTPTLDPAWGTDPAGATLDPAWHAGTPA
jgi:hypothetical protein